MSTHPETPSAVPFQQDLDNLEQAVADEQARLLLQIDEEIQRREEELRSAFSGISEAA